MATVTRRTDGAGLLVRLGTGEAFEVPPAAAGWQHPVSDESAALIAADASLSAHLQVESEAAAKPTRARRSAAEE